MVGLGQVGMWLARGLAVLPALIEAVAIVERWTSGRLHGRQKQDAAVDLTKSLLAVAEGTSGKDLLSDPDVEAAARAAIDTLVALQNVLAMKRVPQR